MFYWRIEDKCSIGGSKRDVPLVDRKRMFPWWIENGCSIGGSKMGVPLLDRTRKERKREIVEGLSAKSQAVKDT